MKKGKGGLSYESPKILFITELCSPLLDSGPEFDLSVDNDGFDKNLSFDD